LIDLLFEQDDCQDSGPNWNGKLQGEHLRQWNKSYTVEPAELPPEMREIAKYVYLQVLGEYLSPVAAPQKKADNQNTDNTAEKQYLEGTQLARQLPPADGHGCERYQGAAHPKSGNDGMISIRIYE
jgi:hypothetical protein